MPRKRAKNGVRSRAAREARAKRQSRYKPTAAPRLIDPGVPTGDLSPEDLYQREKARRADRIRADTNHPLMQALRQYQALLASEAEAGRGGRPKKIVTAKRPAQKSVFDDDA